MNKENKFNIFLLILLIILSLVILFQIIKKLFGGSWTTEYIIIALLILIIGFLFSQARTLGSLESELKNLKTSFRHLASDFKNHINIKE